MKDAKISDFLAMQHALAEEKGWMKDRNPEYAPFSLLWSIDELGEAIAIIKKKGTDGIMNNPSVRERYLEELADTFMYIFDMMECLGISGEEFTGAYIKKFEHNLGRCWGENAGMYEENTLSEIYFDGRFLPCGRVAELIARAKLRVMVCDHGDDGIRGAAEELFGSEREGGVEFVESLPESTDDGRIFIVKDKESGLALSEMFGVPDGE